jgi:hypothetical protein
VTELKRPVRRTVTVRVPHGINPRLVITLYPEGLIGIRESGRRLEVKLAAAVLYARGLRAEG